MPHLVERDDHHISFGRGLGKFARFVADPVENRNVADAQKASNGAKTDIAHGVKKHGQRLHRWRLATWWRHGEIAAAGQTQVALEASNNPVLYMIRSAAALAANLAHGRRLSCFLP